MSYISVYQSDLDYEASTGVISQTQAAQLWQQLSDRDANRCETNLANVTTN